MKCNVGIAIYIRLQLLQLAIALLARYSRAAMCKDINCTLCYTNSNLNMNKSMQLHRPAKSAKFSDLHSLIKVRWGGCHKETCVLPQI